MITIENKIGIEAEVFLQKNGKLVFPSEFGLPSDNFVILAEIRGTCGSTPQESLSNFYEEYFRIKNICDKNKVLIDLSGYKVISMAERAKILRAGGTKELPECKNIYGKDLLTMSDNFEENGNLMTRISSGLHIHFSKKVVSKKTYTQNKKDIFHNEEISILTDNIIKSLVRKMDTILPAYNLGVDLKYRQKGFYEIKPHGFEYRSLPFSDLSFSNLLDIVNYSFKLLENI